MKCQATTFASRHWNGSQALPDGQRRIATAAPINPDFEVRIRLEFSPH